MDLETNVQRVENMIQTCGCNPSEAVEVLEETLKRAKAKNKLETKNNSHSERLDRWKKKKMIMDKS